MSHSSTYMSPGHSIELQYPEMNSNSTMTSYLPETVATAVVGMQPPPQKTTQGCFTQQTCPVLAPQRQDFHQTTLPQQQMYHPVAPTASDVVGHPSCYEFLDDQVPTTSSGLLFSLNTTKAYSLSIISLEPFSSRSTYICVVAYLSPSL